MRRRGNDDAGNMLLLLAGVLLVLSFTSVSVILTQVRDVQQSAATEQSLPIASEWTFVVDHLKSTTSGATAIDTTNSTFLLAFNSTVKSLRAIEAAKGYSVTVLLGASDKGTPLTEWNLTEHGDPNSLTGNLPERPWPRSSTYNNVTSGGELNLAGIPYDGANDGIVWTGTCRRAAPDGSHPPCLQAVYLYVSLSDGEASIEQMLLLPLNRGDPEWPSGVTASAPTYFFASASPDGYTIQWEPAPCKSGRCPLWYNVTRNNASTATAATAVPGCTRVRGTICTDATPPQSPSYFIEAFYGNNPRTGTPYNSTVRNAGTVFGLNSGKDHHAPPAHFSWTAGNRSLELLWRAPTTFRNPVTPAPAYYQIVRESLSGNPPGAPTATTSAAFPWRTTSGASLPGLGCDTSGALTSGAFSSTCVAARAVAQGQAYAQVFTAPDNTVWAATIRAIAYNASSQTWKAGDYAPLLHPLGPLKPPSEPWGFNASNERSPARVDLKWTAPNATGGGITAYHIFRNVTYPSNQANGVCELEPPYAQPCAMQLYAVVRVAPERVKAGVTVHEYVDLLAKPGSQYRYHVTAVSRAGESGRSLNDTVQMPAKPGLPVALEFREHTVGTNDSIQLHWKAADDNHSPITKYRITRWGNVTVKEITVTQAQRDDPNFEYTYTDRWIRGGTSYTYAVSAVNAIGEGKNATIAASRLTRPGPVEGLNWEVADRKYLGNGILQKADIMLFWNLTDNGGVDPADITYTIREVKDPSNGQDPDTYKTPISKRYNQASNTVVLKDLFAAGQGSDDGSHRANVTANNSELINGAGTPPESEPRQVRFYIPSTAPATPTDVTADATRNHIYVNWTAPLGSDVTTVDGTFHTIRNYTVYRQLGGTSTWTAVGNLRVVNGVTPKFIEPIASPLLSGQTYNYAVSAWTIAGESALSAWDSVIIPGKPSKPQQLSATTSVATRSIVLTWLAPSDTGGGAIHYYDINRTWIHAPGSTVGVKATEYRRVGSTLSFTDPNVEPGKLYAYEVRAVNQFGIAGPAERIDSVSTPFRPLPPVNAAIDHDEKSTAVNVTWEAPPVNPQYPATTGYYVYRKGPMETSPNEILRSSLIPVGTTRYADTSTERGRTYEYSVNASSVWGESVRSNVATARLVGPYAPSFYLIPGEGEILVGWSNPPEVDGFPVTGYVVYRTPNFLTQTTPPQSLPSMTFGAEVQSWLDEDVTQGVSYTYYMRAQTTKDGAPLEGAASKTLTAAPYGPPLPPVLPAALDGYETPVRVHLVWNTPAYDGGNPIYEYRVYRSDTPGPGGLPPLASAITDRVNGDLDTSLLYLDFDVAEGGTYYYKVTAVNSAGEGQSSDVVTAKAPRRPEPPATVVATRALDGRSIGVTWGATPNFHASATVQTGYNVWRGTSANGPWGATPVASVSNTTLSWTDTNLEGGTTYHYNVTAYNPIGDSHTNPVDNAATCTAPGPVGQVIATKLEFQYSIQVTWTAPSQDGGCTVHDYEIVRVKDGQETIVATVLNDLTYTDSGLAPDTTYSYRVIAKNLNLGATPVGSLAVTTDPRPVAPSPFTTANATSLTRRAGVDLTWTHPTNVAPNVPRVYQIERKGVTGDYALLATTDGNNTFTDWSVAGESTYHYQVRAVISGTSGEWATATHAQTTGDPNSPPTLTATPSGAGVRLTWTVPVEAGIPGITSYRIYRGLQPTSLEQFTTVAWAGPGTQDYLDTSHGSVTPTAPITYHYKVDAVNPYGASGQSPPASAVGPTKAAKPTIVVSYNLTHSSPRVNIQVTPGTAPNAAPTTNYEIYRGTSPGSMILHANITVTTSGAIALADDTGLAASTSYYYAVKTVNGRGSSEMSDTHSLSTPGKASAPGSVTAVATSTPAKLTISWAAPTNTGGPGVTILAYTINITNVATGALTQIVTTESPPATSYQWNSYVPSQLYRVNVSAKTSIGGGTPSTNVLAPDAPAQPTGLITQATNTTIANQVVPAIRLTWVLPASDGGGAITGYRVYRWTGAQTPVLLVDLPTGAATSSYTDTTVAEGTTYTYRVTAYNVRAEGAGSLDAAATAPERPNAPSSGGGFTVLKRTTSVAIDLTWTAPTPKATPVLGYRVYRGLTSDIAGMTIVKTVTQGTSYTDTAVAEGTQYCYQIKAYTIAGDGPPTTGSSCNMTISKASAPTILTLEKVGLNDVRVTWRQSTDDGGSTITGYAIYQYDTIGGVPTSKGTHVGTIDPLDPTKRSTLLTYSQGGTHYYRMVAVNGAGEGEASAYAGPIAH